jgi:hypothetical protein
VKRTRIAVRLAGTVIAIAGCLALSAAPAGAAPVRAAADGTISVTVTESIEPVSAAPGELSAAAAAEKCWYDHGVETGTLGSTKLWVMESIVVWCGKSGKLTKVTSHQEYFSHHAGGLTILNDPATKLTKIDSTHTVARTTARVKFCILKVGCLGTYDPWISINMYGNGTVSSAGGF